MSTNGPQPSPSAKIRQKQCHHCGRTFARSEHLLRHQRTHTKERPFRCPHCQQSFQRSDVKAAHVRTCPDAPSTPQDGDDHGSPLRKRVRVACDRCRKRKIRCDGNEPCSLCQALQTPCNYASSAKFSQHMNNDRDGLDVFEAADHLTTDPPPVNVQFSNTDGSTEIATPAFLLNNAAHGNTGGQVQIASTDTTFLYDNGAFNLDGPVDASFSDNLWTFPTLDQYWFHNGDPYIHEFPLFNFQSPNHTMASPLQTITSRMQHYFSEKSRPPSPSLDKVNKMWYSRPPNFDSHDKTILAIFLRLFRSHIPNTFALFNDAPSDSRETFIEYVLAMAALGRTFCSVQGSAEVSRSLYNDARRLLLASFNQPAQTDNPHNSLMMAKTFILLELYGLTSGDKRSFEFVEAFHANLADAARAYVSSFDNEAGHHRYDLDLRRLKEALYILDVYRVSIMFRPPAMVWQSIAEAKSWTSGDYDRHLTQQDVNEFVEAVPHSSTLRYPLGRLASVAPFLWPAMYPRQNQYNDDNIHVESLLLAKTDFAGQSLNRWFEEHKHGEGGTDPMHMVLYHTMYILLHANITTLQTYAHSSLGPQTRDVTTSAVAKEIHDWFRSRHFKAAHWHAQQLFSVLEGAFVTAKRDTPARNASRLGSNLADSRSLPYEALHVPYSIYFGGLILWCGIALNSKKATSVQSQAPIARAEKLLRGHRMHVAHLLASVLNDIK